MEPHRISPEYWDQIGRSIVSLAAFAGLALSGGLAFLMLRAPLSPDMAGGPIDSIRWVRRAVSLTVAAALIGAVAALAVGVILAVRILGSIYPRFLI